MARGTSAIIHNAILRGNMFDIQKHVFPAQMIRRLKTSIDLVCNWNEIDRIIFCPALFVKEKLHVFHDFLS